METGSGTENGYLTGLFMVNSLIWVIKFFKRYEKYQSYPDAKIQFSRSTVYIGTLKKLQQTKQFIYPVFDVIS